MKNERIRQWFSEKREKNYPCAHCGEKVFSYWQVFDTSSRSSLKCPLCKKRTQLICWLDTANWFIYFLPIMIFHKPYFAFIDKHGFGWVLAHIAAFLFLDFVIRMRFFSHIQFFKKD